MAKTLSALLAALCLVAGCGGNSEPNAQEAEPLPTASAERTSYGVAELEAEKCWEDWEALGDIPMTEDLQAELDRCFDLGQKMQTAHEDYCAAVLAVLNDSRPNKLHKANVLLQSGSPRCWSNKLTPRLPSLSEQIEEQIRDLGGLRELRELRQANG